MIFTQIPLVRVLHQGPDVFAGVGSRTGQEVRLLFESFRIDVTSTEVAEDTNERLSRGRGCRMRLSEAI